MTLSKTIEIFYGFTLYFNSDFNYVQKKSIPSHMYKAMDTYYKKNKFAMDKYYQYNESTVKLYAIINQLKYRSGHDVSTDMSNSDTIWFKRVLQYYKNDFQQDVDLIMNTCSCSSDIYILYVKKKIEFYSFAYAIALLKFDKTELKQNPAVVQEIKWCMKAVSIFKFDVEYFRKTLQPLQKKIDLLMDFK